MDWVEINDGMDRQADGPSPLYAQAGPDFPSGWTWSVYAAREGAEPVEVEWGTAPDEATAKATAEAWMQPHACNATNPVPVADCRACAVEDIIREEIA